MQQWNATGKGNLEENGLYTLPISRVGRDNWIGEAIVAQAIHEAIRYICAIMIPVVNTNPIIVCCLR